MFFCSLFSGKNTQKGSFVFVFVQHTTHTIRLNIPSWIYSLRFFRVPYTIKASHYLCSSGKHKQLYIGFNISGKILLLFICTCNFFRSTFTREGCTRNLLFISFLV